MVGTLIESRAKRQRRPAGTAVSFLVHSAIVVAALLLTARPTIGRLKPPVITMVTIAPPIEPKPAPPVASRPAPSVTNAPPALRIEAPTLIPVGIPDIDLSAAPTPTDFNAWRGATSCVHGCDFGIPTTDTSSAQTWTGAELAMRLREPPVPPRYPERLRAAGVDGNVLVRFVVDTTGRVAPGSIEILESSHELFTAAVRETLARLRFLPAEVNGRKVTAAAMMPFQFTLKK